MGGRSFSLLVVAGALVLAGCGERQSDAPTSPEFKGGPPPSSSCSFNTVSTLVKNEFGANSSESSLATDMKNAGDKTNAATYIGYQILKSIASVYGGYATSMGSASNAAQLTVALLQCMNVGTDATIPSVENVGMALSSTGAFGVRGLGGISGLNPDTISLYSHDRAWLIKPPQPSSWQDVDSTHTSGLADSVKHALLVYGFPADTTNFTKDSLASSVFQWNSAPTADFVPGVIIGECNTDDAYLQHNTSTSSPEVLGFVDPLCGTGQTAMKESAPRSLAERIIRFFEPAPLMATALATTGTGGSKGSLSPFGVVHPGKTLLQAQFQWSTKSKYFVNTYFNPTVSYNVNTLNGTIFRQPYILVWLEATNNQGSTVVLCNNYAYTNANGLVSLPNAYLNKAGGYTITTHIAGAFSLFANGKDQVIPDVPPQDPVSSPLINVQNKAGSATGCEVFTPIYDQNMHITNPPTWPGPNTF